MKKIVVLMLLMLTSFTISKTAYATTTFALDTTVGINGSTYNSSAFSNEVGEVGNEAYAINFTYIKKIKIDIDYQFGKYQDNYTSLNMELRNIQVGFPIVNSPKQLIYITIGGMRYSEDTNMSILPKHDADGVMRGVDLVVIPTDKFQVELNLQKSLRGRCSTNDIFSGTNNYVTDLTIYKIKLRYILADNLGLTFNYRSMENNIRDSTGDDVVQAICSMGFVYRL